MSLCAILCVCMQVDNSLQSLEDMMSSSEEEPELGGGVNMETAQELLEHGTALVESLKQEYNRAKTLGEDRGEGLWR